MVKTPLSSKVKNEADSIQVSKRKYLFVFLLSTTVSIGWFVIAGFAWILAGLGGAKASYSSANVIYWGTYLFIVLATTLFFRKFYHLKFFQTLIITLLPGIMFWLLLGSGVYFSKRSIRTSQTKRVQNLQNNVGASDFSFRVTPHDTKYYNIETNVKVRIEQEKVSFSDVNFGILDKEDIHLQYEGKDERATAIYIDRVDVKYRSVGNSSDFQTYNQRAQHEFLYPGEYDFEVVFEKWLESAPSLKLKSYQFVVFIPTGGLTRIKSFDFEGL